MTNMKREITQQFSMNPYNPWALIPGFLVIQMDTLAITVDITITKTGLGMDFEMDRAQPLTALFVRNRFEYEAYW
ncbi:hypothetical protein C0J52_14728 [Blattella germanica]|nr:hypothetical protein C0J52_14728 [Blattella germanica]